MISIFLNVKAFKNLHFEGNIELKKWLQPLEESDTKSHALLILSDIISRYFKRSESVQNHKYYMDCFELSKNQVIEVIEYLESFGILTRYSICNINVEDDSLFNIVTLSDEFKQLIYQQFSEKQTQGNTQ